LDIFDAESGENLTEREVYHRRTERKNEEGKFIIEEKNYLDYFHSLLHVALDGKHFLSNGWIWSPIDEIFIFETDKFLNTFETGNIAVNLHSNSSNYNWDRPCTFINNDLFVVAVDDAAKADNLEEDEKETYEYKQLAFFNLSDAPQGNNYDYQHWINPCNQVSCTAFPVNEYGEVKGRLYYDEKNKYLVALTADGAFAVNLTGEIIARLPEIICADVQMHGDFGSQYREQIGWDYSPKYHVFYTWQEGIGIVERKFNFSPIM
jgi:hypothetical protein